MEFIFPMLSGADLFMIPAAYVKKLNGDTAIALAGLQYLEDTDSEMTSCYYGSFMELVQMDEDRCIAAIHDLLRKGLITGKDGDDPSEFFYHVLTDRINEYFKDWKQ